MKYSFNNEEIADVVMFKKILPTDLRTTFFSIQKYAGLLNAPPDSVLHHKTLVLLSHLRYRYYIFSNDHSPISKSYCSAYEDAFPGLKAVSCEEHAFPPPPIEWDDVELEAKEDDGTLHPIEYDSDVEDDLPFFDACDDITDSEVEIPLCDEDNQDSQIEVRPFEPPADVGYKEYVAKKCKEKKPSEGVQHPSIHHKVEDPPRVDVKQHPPIKVEDMKFQKVTSCSPTFGIQLVRAVHGVPVRYADRGSRVARKLLGLPDDCEAHLYFDHSGTYYACGGSSEVDCIRAIQVPDRSYFFQSAYAYKGKGSTILLTACDVSIGDERLDAIRVDHSEVLGWNKQKQETIDWITNLRRDGQSQVTSGRYIV